MKRITLDIDNKKYKPYGITIDDMLKKIIKRPCCHSLECTDSPSTNGYHITIWCKGCGACRLAFDDQKRFKNDNTLRTEHQQNILFDTYTIHGNHSPITL